MHPEQAELYKLLGEYDYHFLNSENIPDVRQRNLSWITTITREFTGKRVMAITHHLTILAARANFERLSREEFLHLEKHEKPLNCGVTRSRCPGRSTIACSRFRACAWWRLCSMRRCRVIAGTTAFGSPADPSPRAKEDTSAGWARVMPGFFETIGAKMAMGRPFTESR
jgi:Histidine phosphatase superfamily (branch 1)